jgi:NAD(P)-dependent dehydrogenase (short-subunit alcohol dehydrogenase family)
VTGIFGKLAGVEASKADRIADLVKETFATFPRAGATDDIARAAVYLASDGSTFVNGQDIVVVICCGARVGQSIRKRRGGSIAN